MSSLAYGQALAVPILTGEVEQHVADGFMTPAEATLFVARRTV
ncbi:MAG TPA: hypothetical protein VIZ18_04775 [Ktedonobacteraceae bacterium]